jgi:hypothetical protein
MEFEDRNGPHGTGRWRTTLAGVRGNPLPLIQDGRKTMALVRGPCRSLTKADRYLLHGNAPRDQQPIGLGTPLRPGLSALG